MVYSRLYSQYNLQNIALYKITFKAEGSWVIDNILTCMSSLSSEADSASLVRTSLNIGDDNGNSSALHTWND